MRMSRLSCVLLAVFLAACGTQEQVGETPGDFDLEKSRAELLEGIRESVDQALATQKQVLEETAALVAAPEGASVDTIEAALGSLNRALIQGRQAASALRSQDIENKKALLQPIWESNNRVRDAYDALVPHHPDPASLSDLVLGDEAGQ